MSHGSSKASWTAVLVCLAGILIGGVALIPDPNWVLFTIGTVMALLSGPIGLIMSRAGFGAERAPAAKPSSARSKALSTISPQPSGAAGPSNAERHEQRSASHSRAVRLSS